MTLNYGMKIGYGKIDGSRGHQQIIIFEGKNIKIPLKTAMGKLEITCSMAQAIVSTYASWNVAGQLIINLLYAANT